MRPAHPDLAPRARRSRLRAAALACALAAIGACEGTSFRCDPSLSFSTVRHPPSESDAGAPVLHQCVGECWIWRIALGARHTCVVAGDALEVACFGANEAGQSSPSSDADEVPPTWVGQRSTFTEGSSTIAAGALATCVVVQRSIVCWGSGAVLGGADHDPPRVVPLPEGAEAMSVESGEVVLRAGTEADGWYVFGAYEVGRPLADAPLGEPRAWGSEERPLYAIGGFFYWTAGPVSLSRSVVGAIPPPGRLDRALLATERTLGPTWADPFWRMQAGSLHACAWIEGELDCAGQNERGQFGRRPTSWSGFQRLSPPDGVAWIAAACVGGHLDVRADGDEIVVGERRGGHTCVRDTEGGVWCIGANDRGQLGDGTLTDRDVPVRVVGLPGRVRDIACGGEHTCALVGSDVYCWGDNSYGQLGVPSSELTLRATPERVALE